MRIFSIEKKYCPENCCFLEQRKKAALAAQLEIIGLKCESRVLAPTYSCEP